MAKRKKAPQRPPQRTSAAKPVEAVASDDDALLEFPALASPPVWIGIGIAALTAFAYFAVRHHEFVALDDGLYVVDNPPVRNGLSWAGVVWAFTTGHATNWHPLTWLSHMLDVQLFGLDAGSHHVVSLLLHIANSLLLFSLLRAMTGAMWRSAFVAALFALHPLHVESVAWVSERKDVLSTLFFFLTLRAYAAYVQRRSPMRYLVTLSLFAVGLLAKPMLVTVPFVLLLLDVWPLNRARAFGGGTGALEARALFWEKVPFLALAAASSIVTVIAQSAGGAIATMSTLPFSVRFTNAFVGYVTYAYKTFWPTHLAAFYPLSRAMPMYLGLAALAGLTLLTFILLKAARSRPYLAVGWLWFVGTLVPVIGLVQVGMQSTADRYTYVPLIGLFICVAWGVPELLGAARRTQVAMAVAATAILAGCVVTTRAQVASWHDSVSLWTHALQSTPNNYRAHSALGGLLAEAGKSAEAIPHLREAIRLESDFPDSYNNLGIALQREGHTDEAITQFNQAIRLNPTTPGPYSNLGGALEAQGRMQEAIDAYQRSLAADPNFAIAHANFGRALATAGRVDEALDHFARAIALAPATEDVERKTAQLLMKQGKLPDSAKLYQHMLRVSPSDAGLHTELGFAYMAMGRGDEAIAEYTGALRLNPDLGAAHQYLGFALAASSKFDEAVPHFRDAVRLMPDSEEAHSYLGMALGGLGKTQEAIKEFREVLRINPANEQAQRALAALTKKAGGG